MGRVAARLGRLLLATSAAAVAVAEELACAADAPGGCPTAAQSPVNLLQVVSEVTNRGRGAAKESLLPQGVPEGRPWGRTILSTNPQASADFFVRYFEAELVDLGLPSCDKVEQVAVKKSWANTTYMAIFMRDDSMNMTLLESIVDTVDKSVGDVFQKERIYDPWFDNHDMFIDDPGFRFDLAIQDKIDIAIFEWRFGVLPKVRFLIPYTMWTWEVVVEREVALNLGMVWLEDTNNRPSCGDIEQADANREDYPKTPWMKSTFMSADPFAALHWVVDVLGAEQMISPYPNPPIPGCTTGTWAVYPKSGYMFHFVENLEYEKTPGAIAEFAASVEGQRNLMEGVFDPLMHDSLIIEVESLDPYLEKLQARSQPFFLTMVSAEEQALFMDIPNNGIIVQLRSRSLATVAAAQGEVPCAQSGSLLK